MSSSFKYLDKAQVGGQPDKAQAFLDEKLTKNKYTIKQQDTGSSFDPSRYTESQLASLKDNGGPSHHFETKYNTVVTNQDAIDKASSAATDEYRGFGKDSDSGRNYASGAWGSGDLDAAALAAKYNLDTSNEGRGDGHIWGRNADGSEVYIGKSSMDLASNETLIANHAKQANDAEVKHSDIPESLSSSGDIKGAILTEWKGGTQKTKVPEAIEKQVAIEHSPEIEQAKERVRAYEDDVLSGKTSEDIYGGNPSDKYNLDLNKGTDGIGSFIPNTSEQATASFLDNKKTQIKDKYQFKPQN
jgi:hypothetical protein